MTVTSGTATYCGFELRRETRRRRDNNAEELCLRVGQENYTFEVLRRYHVEKCSPAAIPRDRDQDEEDEEGSGVLDVDLAKVREAQEMVGALHWLSVRSRPDITRSVSRAAETMLIRQDVSIKRCKRVLRYLRETVGYHLQASLN